MMITNDYAKLGVLGTETAYYEADASMYRYQTLTSGGLKEEGAPLPVLYPTEETAWDAYALEFNAYMALHPGQLVWRVLPQALQTGLQWYVYSRLVTIPSPYQIEQTASAAVNGVTNGRTFKGPVSTNKSGFRACGHRVLLIGQQKEEYAVSTGGIMLPTATQQKEQQHQVIATVVEIGPDCWSDLSTDFCKVGDKVLVGQYVGKFHDSPLDGKTYRFVQDLDIITPLVEAE